MERCETFHDYYLIEVYTPFALTVTKLTLFKDIFYPGCELQPGYFYLSIPELYYIPEDGACIGAAGVDRKSVV